MRRILFCIGSFFVISLLSVANASPELPFYNRKEECVIKLVAQMYAYQHCIEKGINEISCIENNNRNMMIHSNPRNNPVNARKVGVPTQKKWEALRDFYSRNIKKAFHVYRHGYSSQVYGPAPHMPQYFSRIAESCESIPGTVRWSSSY